MTIVERIISCCSNIGILLKDDLDQDLKDTFETSLTFIMFIVQLEEEFKIEIDEKYLFIEYFQTLRKIKELIEKIIEEQYQL